MNKGVPPIVAPVGKWSKWIPVTKNCHGEVDKIMRVRSDKFTGEKFEKGIEIGPGDDPVFPAEKISYMSTEEPAGRAYFRCGG